MIILTDENNVVVGCYLDNTIVLNKPGISLPERMEQFGKDSVLKYNPDTGEVFYEYIDRPLTSDEKIAKLEQDNALMQQALDDLILNGGTV